MTETVRYSPILLEDLALGFGSKQIELADGRVAVLSEVNLDAVSSVQYSQSADLYPYKVQHNQYFGLAGYKTLTDALAAIGSLERTLYITRATTVSANLTIPSNVKLVMTAAGMFTVASGATLTINGPFIAGIQQVFSSDSSVSFAEGSVPRFYLQWFGGKGDASTDCSTPLNSLEASFPSSGGTIDLTAGTYNLSTTATFTKPVIIDGAGFDVAILQMSTTGSLLHGVSTSKSLLINNATLKVQTAPSSNLNMKAINLDLPTTSGHRVILNNVKIRGFNIGVYVDGRGASLNSHDVDLVHLQNCDIQVSGASGSATGCAQVHGCKRVLIDTCELDQNSVGDHACYLIRNRNVTIRHSTIQNTAGVGSSGVKLATNLAGDTVSLNSWIMEDCSITNCAIAVTIALEAATTLGNLTFKDTRISTVTSTTATDYGAFYVGIADTSVLDNLVFENVTVDDVQLACISLQNASTSSIGNVVVRTCTFKDWSNASSASYAAIAMASTGTIKRLSIDDVYIDGESTGRSLLPVMTAGIPERLYVKNVRETGLAGGGAYGSWIFTLENNDTTPSVQHGEIFYVSNSGATTITQLDDADAGKHVYLTGTNSNTTLTDGTNFKLNGDWVSANQKQLHLFTPDGTTWFEVGRAAA